MVSRRLLRYLPPLLGVLVLTGIVFGLHHALAHVSLGTILSALAATPRRQLLHALELLGGSLLFMAFYDLPGVLFAKRAIHFPWIGFRHVWFASFCAYSLSHVLGAPTLSGTAIRVRLYAEWNVPASGIARIIALIGATFPLGMAGLIGGIMLFDPLELPLFGHRVSVFALQAIGAVLWGLIAAYLAAARGRTPLMLFRREVPRPGLPLAVSQVLLSCADTSIACGILYAVLPAASGLGYSHLLAIYLAGFAGGMFSGLPAGVGVLDTVLLLGLTPYMPASDAIVGILLYRVLYYLLPAVIGSLSFAAHEIWLTAKSGQAGME